MNFVMQARSSSSGLLVTWASTTPDFAGGDYPGPGSPLHIAVSQRNNAPGGSLGGTLDAATVKQIDGLSGNVNVAPKTQTLTGDVKLPAFTHEESFGGVAALTTAYTSPAVAAAGAYKLNVAVVATAASGADVASWDFSMLLRYTGSTLSIQGTTPSGSGIAPDNFSSGASAWLATVDVSGATVRVRAATATGARVGVVYQLVPVLP